MILRPFFGQEESDHLVYCGYARRTLRTAADFSALPFLLYLSVARLATKCFVSAMLRGKNPQVILFVFKVNPVLLHYFNASSRSSTDFSSLIRMVVREGKCAVGVLWAVTRAGWLG